MSISIFDAQDCQDLAKCISWADPTYNVDNKGTTIYFNGDDQYEPIASILHTTSFAAEITLSEVGCASFRDKILEHVINYLVDTIKYRYATPDAANGANFRFNLFVRKNNLRQTKLIPFSGKKSPQSLWSGPVSVAKDRLKFTMQFKFDDQFRLNF